MPKMPKKISPKTLKKIKISIGVSLGILATGGLGFGIGYLAFWKKKDQKELISYEFREKSVKIDGQEAFKIREANDKDYQNIHYWLNDGTFDKLVELIQTELNYGPEIFQIKKIELGNENVISPHENGLYSPTTNEIFINLKNFKEKIGNFEDQKLFTREAFVEQKARMIFEIIYHEYGHHISQAYLQTYPFGTKYADNEISLDNEDKYWNEDFSNKFELYLNYINWNKTHPLYSNEMFPENEKKKYRSIGSLFSQEDLFNLANKSSDKTKDLRTKWNDAQLNKNSNGNADYIFGNKYSRYVVNTNDFLNNIKYLYSIEELFTRKYQLLTQIFKPILSKENHYNSISYSGYNFIDPTNPMTNEFLNNSFYFDGIPQFAKGEFVKSGIYKGNYFWNSSLNVNELYNFQDPIFGTPEVNNGKVLERTELESWKGQSTSTKPEDKYNNLINSNRYLYDALFDQDFYGLPNHEDDLYNLMDKHIGHKDGYDISFIWNKNPLSVVSANTIRLPTASERKEAIENMRFSGFIPKINNTFKSIGYIGDDQQYHKISDISIHKFKYQYKDKVNALSHKILDSSLENLFYVTNDFVNPSNFLNKKMVFVDDKGKQFSLNSTRDTEEAGIARSYFPFQNDIYHNSSFYKAVSIKHEVKFIKGKLEKEVNNGTK